MGEISEMEAMELEVVEECPVKQVELTVPKTDDPTLPDVTFRMWVLSLGVCVVLSFVNQFFWNRKMPLIKLYYKRKLTFLPALLVMITTQTRSMSRMGEYISALYGLGFATQTATIFHVLLFYGSATWRDLWGQTKNAFKGNKKMDIHTKLMKKYKSVPTWWFVVILVLNIALVLFTCEYYNESLQLPWWGVVLACAIAFFFTLPIGIIAATINQAPGLNIITESVIGYMYPEHSVANMCFKVYGYISMTQALTFILDFKLGHYMKIPPRSMLMEQVVGALAPLLVWLAHKAFPNKEGIRLIHMPVLLGGTSMMLPATAVNFTSWLIVCFLSGFVVFKYRPDWWKRYNYVLLGGLDAGTAFMTVLLFLTMQSKNIGLQWWGNNGERCLLAACPTAKGVTGLMADGCPVT
ncbi:hypothetical protein CRYUN_Cryun19dG0094500 [Craigia yunnanensis]